MSTIHHYSNLVCWEETERLINSHPEVNHVVYIDSLSMCLLAWIVSGLRISRHPGSSARSIAFSHLESNSSCYLLAREYPKNNYFDPLSSVIVPQNVDIEKFSEITSDKIVNHEIIFLGISSPKQNEIACTLAKINSNSAHFYCIGAILDDLFSGKTSFQFLSPFGLEWLGRMLTNPKRATYKIKVTLHSFCKILKCKVTKNKFIEHIKKTQIYD